MDGAFKKLCRICGETIVRYRLIEEGDRILVALSGGADSFTLIHLLSHFRESAPIRFDLLAGTFDPGYADFNLPGIAEYCRECGWEHVSCSLPIAEIIEEKGFQRAPCVLCSRLRRGKLYALAKEHNCGKLALGQHLDDVAASFLMSLCRGQGLTTMAPRVAPENPEHPTVIRPMALAPEALVKRCAEAWKLPEAGACRYQKLLAEGDRFYFKGVIDEWSRRIPEVRSNLARSLTRVESDHLLLPPGGDK